MANLDCVELTQYLVRKNTMMGTDGEREVIEFLANLLEDAGFSVVLDEYDSNNSSRCSLSAHLHPEIGGPALCLAGHIDTVPLGNQPWTHDPFSAEIVEGLMYGRGSCDMKSGMASMICAALRAASSIRDRDFVVQSYGGEERGCLGSFHVVKNVEQMKNIAAAVVGEPTGALPVVGHKGALWLTLRAKGKTAHASMPDQGINALAAMLPAATRLLDFQPGGSHEHLGPSTSVVSSLHSGLNSNSVPDLATLTVDMRTVPGNNHAELVARVKKIVGSGVDVETVLDILPIWTEPDNPWASRVLRLYEELSGKEAGIFTAHYFTDAAAIYSVLPDIPMLIFGPGFSAQAHQVDEFCPVEQIVFMEKMYTRIIEDWYGIGIL